MKVLKDRLKSCEKVFATTVSCLNWSGIIQVMRNETLDFLIFDFEHGRLTAESAEEMLRMCNVLGVPVVARVQEIEYTCMSKVFDMGADGILAPRLETMEQALRVVESVRFPPKGKKGCGGFSLLHGLNSVEEFNAAKIVLLQMESPLGIRNLDSILDVSEWDGVVVGPYDLSIAMGIPVQFDNPAFKEQVTKVMAICRNRGISCGIYCDSAEEVRHWRGQGMNILWAGGDIGFLKQGYNEMCRCVESLD